MVISAPPRTPFQNIDQLVAFRPEWRTLLLTGAMGFALNALRYNWVSDEFSLNGCSVVTVLLPDGREMSLSIESLYEVLHEDR
jgi:hypothetical protein